MFLVVGHIYFLCMGQNGVVALVLWVFGVFWSCYSSWWSLLGGIGRGLISLSSLFICIHPWRWGCLIFRSWKFRALFFRGFEGVGSTSLFGIWIVASKSFANSLIALSWESTTRKVNSGRGVWKAFTRSASSITEVGNFHKCWEEGYFIWCGLSSCVNIVAGVASVIIECWSKIPST